MRLLYFLLLLGITTATAQELTGQQLLDKAIEHHDPNDNWSQFIGKFQVMMTTPSNPERLSKISLNNSLQSFHLEVWKEGRYEEFDFQLGECQSYIDEPEAREKECDKTIFMRDYYTYLYGLPMKLKDPGTVITNLVERKTFKGKEYLVLEVMYDENVGSDVWYFYFDPTTFKMEIYQFFKRDKKGDIDTNSGEYIVLTDNHQINDINMPKVRKWYYNKDDQFLGTDVITR